MTESSGKAITHIDGRISTLPQYEAADQEGKPIRDVKVTLSSGPQRLATTTSSLGKYAFAGIPPGAYRLSAGIEGYRPVETAVVVAAKGCVHRDIHLQEDRVIEGTVRNQAGEPVGEVVVDLIPTDPRVTPPHPAFLMGISDETGKYSIEGIPPGEYFVILAKGKIPSKDHPYRRTYFPDTTDIRQATPVLVGAGTFHRQIDLRLPVPLKTVPVKVKIRNAEEQGQVLHITQAGSLRDLRADLKDLVTFELCEGVTYIAYAAGQERYSKPVQFTPGSEGLELTLVIDTSSEEFNKLLETLDPELK